ncbi:MAG TPA: biotin-dependent carboxyltransferase family protein [Thiolinea sp.]|nr:biotin-dependent carboxyltransferase family protein [Thiolinea sp.]
MRTLSGLNVVQPGMLTLLTDAGRLGQHGIGLTTGGPMDRQAFLWANRLCGNDLNATALEVSVGGLVLEAQTDTTLAVTGAELPLSLNRKPAAHWRTHSVRAGDRIELGFARQGLRAYLAVAGGFAVTPRFGSTATVVREGIGGLDGQGSALKAGDRLPCAAHPQHPQWQLPETARPEYAQPLRVRVIPGYQQADFDPVQQAIFFSSLYTVSKNCDRMGYRLEGPAVKTVLRGMLSEGICLGAIQIPADGQPIVLLHDRQTIGGYPKIGSVLSLDLDALTQLAPGGQVGFEAISMAEAHNALLLARYRFETTPLQALAQDGE